MSLFQQFPDLRQVISFLILPVALIYGLLPFGAFIVFLLLFFAVVRNERISHFIRFNTMQTILIGILLSLLQLVVFRIIFPGFGSGLFVQTLCNTIFFGRTCCLFLFYVSIGTGTICRNSHNFQCCPFPSSLLIYQFQ